MQTEQTLESSVDRRKDGDEPRVGCKFTLAASTVEALKRHSAQTDIPMARSVDRAIRRLLGMEDGEQTEVELALRDLCEGLGVQPPPGLHHADIVEKYIARDLELRGII